MDRNHIDLTPEIRLAEAAKSGSKEAFCELYGTYKDKLYRYALYRLGNPDDAEDAVSECVLAAWKGIPQLRNSEAFGAWIFRILHNCCVRRIRESVNLRDNLQRIYDDGPSSSHAAGAASLPASVSVEIREALALLNEEEQTIVLLSVLGGLTSREISGITTLTPGAVRSKLSRSLARMREYLS